MQEIYEKALKAVLIVAVVSCLSTMIIASICCLTMAKSNERWLKSVYDYEYPPIIMNEQTINQ